MGFSVELALSDGLQHSRPGWLSAKLATMRRTENCTLPALARNSVFEIHHPELAIVERTQVMIGVPGPDGPLRFSVP